MQNDSGKPKAKMCTRHCKNFKRSKSFSRQFCKWTSQRKKTCRLKQILSQHFAPFLFFNHHNRSAMIISETTRSFAITASPLTVVSFAVIVWASHATLPPCWGREPCVTSPNNGCEGDYAHCCRRKKQKKKNPDTKGNCGTAEP